MKYLTCEKPKPPALIKLHDSPTIKRLAERFGEKLEQIKKVMDPQPNSESSTSRWCILSDNIIHIERSADWDAHLNCVKKMIMYYHAYSTRTKIF